MDLQTREDFCRLITLRDYRVAVEVGVKYGYFSDSLLTYGRSLRILFSVDRWDLLGDLSRKKHYRAAVSRLSRHGERSRILRMSSVDAAAKILSDGAGPVDFVYIDGDHSRRGVTKDIAAWWPLVRPGGVMAGHDYIRHPRMPFGIVEAVDDFLVRNPTLTCRLTGVPGIPDIETRHEAAATRLKPFAVIPSWWIEKPYEPTESQQPDAQASG